MRLICGFVLALLSVGVGGESTPAQVTDEAAIASLPDSIGTQIYGKQFADKYEIDLSHNPFYLRGDFDGDGIADYAVAIRLKLTGEHGICVWLSSRSQPITIGAGRAARDADGRGTESLVDFQYWRVYKRQPVQRGVGAGKPPVLSGEAIEIGQTEGASGLFFWNGRRFAWYQQGD
jgi:hypothetical protein